MKEEAIATELLSTESKRYRFRHKWYGYAMIAPAMLLLFIFVIIPFAMALYQSFTNYYTFNPDVQFVGFTNYVRILQDPSFFKSLGNVVLMTTIFAIAMVVLSFLFACVLKKLNARMSSFAKIIVYIPHLLSGIIISIIFIFIFSSN